MPKSVGHLSNKLLISRFSVRVRGGSLTSEFDLREAAFWRLPRIFSVIEQRLILSVERLIFPRRAEGGIQNAPTKMLREHASHVGEQLISGQPLHRAVAAATLLRLLDVLPEDESWSTLLVYFAVAMPSKCMSPWPSTNRPWMYFPAAWLKT